MGRRRQPERRARLLVWAALAICAVPSPAAARPRYLKGFEQHYGDLLPAALAACTTCHIRKEEAEDPESFEKRPPHNPFGARLRELGRELKRAGESAEISARLERAAEEDADGDGALNEIELLAGRAPGRVDDVPGADEIERARTSQRELRTRHAGYRWQPFRPIVRPAPPAVDRGWARGPSDAFIAEEHAKRGLEPRPDAPRGVLLRRLHLDLVGLPPAPEELREFLDDDAPDAADRVADRLLASPRHGERWGRHWMDVWRYSDWAGWGQQVRDSQPHIWRWRDWIVDSLNADKGYDRMVLEMLAGDEIAPLDRDVVRATGYVARNFKLLSREAWMQEAVDHCAQAFLGLTAGCARCHDHRYDPLTQEEYYRLRAIFEPHRVRLDRVPGQSDTAKDGVARVFDAEPEAPTYLFERGDDRRPVKDRALEPGVPEFLTGPGFPELRIDPVPLPLTAHSPERAGYIIEETRAAASAAAAAARKAFEAALIQALRAEAAAAAADSEARAKLELDALAAREDASIAEMDVPLAEARLAALEATLAVEALEDAGAREREPERWKDAATAATAAQRWSALLEARRARAAGALAVERARRRAEQSPQDAAATKALEAAGAQLAEAETNLAAATARSLLEPDTQYAPRPQKTYPATSTGRRLALARWIADRRNPLAARVAANHIWLRHFGQALVPSPADFGANGRAPTHPALLDWLAAELMDETERGWTMKRLHRAIVTSSAYRMDSTPDARGLAADPDNRWLWRMAPRRLEAEVVRDSILHVAGRLEGTMGGPELDQNAALSTHRRSLYYRNAPEKQVEFLRLFDMAAPGECYERRASIVPQQALALANSELVLVVARHLAHDLAAESDRSDDATSAFVTLAFERVLSRPPTRDEARLAMEFLTEQEALFGGERGKLATFKEPQPAKSAGDGKRPSPDPALRARENLVHALMNHNEVVTLR